MKTLLAIVLGFIGCSTLAIQAADKPLRAGVIAQDYNAELRTPGSTLSAGRRSFNVGEVYEIANTTGRFEELKVDDKHVALVPTSSLRIRECSAAELAQAKAKFNVLSQDNQQNARKEIVNAKKKAQAQASTCSTCPVAQAAAQKNLAAASRAYTEQTKALKKKQQALVKEALDWAAGQASPTTAAK